MKKNYDIIIIGGGIIGLAAAYYLSQKKMSVALFEKEYLGSGSTGRCIGGIRQQFSTEAAIKLMQESVRLFRMMKEEFGFDVEYYEGGYLFLAHDEKRMETFRQILPLQKKLGLNVELLNPQECLKIVPDLNPDQLVGGVFSPEDGQAFPFKVLYGYYLKAKELKADFYFYQPVKKILISNDRVSGVELSNGEKYSSKMVLNCAGPWAAEIGKTAGLDLPVFPEVHEAMITARFRKLFATMIVDYRQDGCYFYQRINGQVIGCYSPVPNRPGLGKETTREFLSQMSKRTIRLIPPLKDAQVIRQWAGCYEMTPDGSPIIDRTPIDGFYVSIGMSGHGFMFGPAAGEFIARIITENSYPFEWSEFSYNRSFSRQELMK